jgi:hypothetical protein
MTARPPSQDIAGVLAAAQLGALGAATGWGIYRSLQPDSPDTTITLYDTGGLDPDPALLLDQPSLMIHVRGIARDYDGARAKAQEVKDALLGLPAQTLGGTFYGGAVMKGDVFFLGYDNKSRPVFTLNFQLMSYCRNMN